MRFSYRSSEIQIPHPASLASSSVLWTPARAWTRRRGGSFGHYQIILFRAARVPVWEAASIDRWRIAPTTTTCRQFRGTLINGFSATHRFRNPERLTNW